MLLGPLLFIICINDLPQQVKQCEPFGYADDYKLVTTDPANLQVEIDKIKTVQRKQNQFILARILGVTNQKKKDNEHKLKLDCKKFDMKND